MLQQTRVEAVKGYYTRFLETVPDVAALAQCDDDVLHKLWEGLGYYSRVRNLKKAAQVIMTQYGGTFPQKYEEILSLPGIGEYTAGAIASIAFNQPTPAVDGNVLRVLSRLTNDPSPIDAPAVKAAARQQLAAIYPPQAGNFTQALMELGATLCGPNWAPRCAQCPCQEFCLAHLHGTAQQLPVRSPKREKKVEERTVFILSCDGKYALRKRPQQGLLAGLWEFPNVPGRPELPEVLAEVEKMGLRPKEILRTVEKKHIFTHIRWEMRGVYMEVREPAGDFTWLTAEQIDSNAALPTAFRQFWEEQF
jgi:A/G-specific adenine glycosylase